MKKPVYKILLGISGLALLLFLASILLDWKGFPGPTLIAFFIFLAFGVRGNELFRSFSYTIMIFAAVSISMFYPRLFIQWGDFRLETAIVPLLQIIMFGMGSQMSFRDFAGVVKMPKGVLVGLVCQFTIMPVVGFTIATTFGFPPEIAAGIILVGSSPSGLASNVMSFIAKANLALSVTLTAVATMLAPLITPSLMKLLAGQFVPVDFWDMMLGIINIVILPIVAGLMFNATAYGRENRKSISWQALVYFLIITGKNIILFRTAGVGIGEALIQLLKDLGWFLVLPVLGALAFRHLARGSKEYLDRVMAFISMAGIGVIIVVITAAGRDSLLEIGFLLIVACLLHNCTGYLLGYWICRLAGMDERSCRTIGLAPAVFGPMMNITGSSLATWWRGKPADENG